MSPFRQQDPLSGYSPDWRERLRPEPPRMESVLADPTDDPLAGYSPDWRERAVPPPPPPRTLPEPTPFAELATTPPPLPEADEQEPFGLHPAAVPPTAPTPPVPPPPEPEGDWRTRTQEILAEPRTPTQGVMRESAFRPDRESPTPRPRIGEEMGPRAAAAAAAVDPERAIQQATEVLARYEHLRDLPMEEKLKHAVASLPVGVAEIIAGPLDFVAVTAKELDSRLPGWIQEHGEKGAEELFTAQLADRIREFAQTGWLSEDPVLQENLLYSLLPAAFGSFGSYTTQGLALNAVGRALNLGRNVGTVGAMASATGGGVSRGYREAIEAGVDEDVARGVGFASAPGGLVQVMGPVTLINRIGAIRRGAGAGLTRGQRTLRSGAAGTIEEAGAESGGQILFNAAARIWDPERDLFEGVGQAGLVGGLAGGTFGAGLTAVTPTGSPPQIRGTPEQIAQAKAEIAQLETHLSNDQDVDGTPLTPEGRWLMEMTIRFSREGVAEAEAALGGEAAAPDPTPALEEPGTGMGLTWDPDTGVVTPGLPQEAAQAAPRPDPLEGYTPNWRERLGRATEGVRRRVADAILPEGAAERRRATEELEQAFVDPRTGMANETAFAAAQERLDADPSQHTAAFDLTQFKAVNDNLGRPAGDQRLAEVAEIIREEAGALGIAERDQFRAGGDEFAVVHSDPAVLDELGRRVEARVEPLQAGGFVSAVRYGVGPTWADADAAAQERKQEEEGPRYRDVTAAPEAAIPPAPQEVLDAVTEEVATELFGLEWVDAMGEEAPSSLGDLLRMALSTAEDGPTHEYLVGLADQYQEYLTPEERAEFGVGADPAEALAPAAPPEPGVEPALPQFPRAGDVVDGRTVGENIPNRASIRSSFHPHEYDVVGVREIPLDAFEVTDARDLFYAADDIRRSSALAQEIQESGRIDPLIVVVDEEGVYVLEGVHRLAALSELGARSLPALVVEARQSRQVEPGIPGDATLPEPTVRTPETVTDAAPDLVTEGIPPPGREGLVHPSALQVDPDRFQFRLHVGQEGVDSRLSGTQWDPDARGVILVWTDPADGNTYVVNGHHRHRRATEVGVGQLLVRHIEAATDTEARFIGAMVNIKEGNASPLDAGKVFRDGDLTAEDIAAVGVPPNSALAQKGLALARLPEAIFREVATGRMRENRGVVIGNTGMDETGMLALHQMVKGRKQDMTDEQVAELGRFVAAAEQTTETQETLFGTEEMGRSLAPEKAEVSAYIRKQIRAEKRDFGFAARRDRAERLEEAGVGALDAERGRELAMDAAQAEELYNRESVRTGDISTLLNEAARRIADGENATTVKQEAYEAVRRTLSEQAHALTERAGTEGAPEAGPRGAGTDGPSLFGDPSGEVAEASPAYGQEPQNLDELISGMAFFEEGRVGAKMDRSLLKKLGANMYTKPVPWVVTKESLQNSVDAVRGRENARITVDINTTENRFVIHDNGSGMTPDVAANAFMDPGGSEKPGGSSGGYGLAKVGLFSNAERIVMETVADTPEGRFRTTVEGTADDWMEGNMVYRSEQVGRDAETGTRLEIHLEPQDTWHYAEDFLSSFLVHDRTNIDFDVRWDGNEFTAREWRRPKGIPDQPTRTVEVDGATIDFYESSGTESGRQVPMVILNNGLYQLEESGWMSVPGEYPKVVVVDVKPTVDTMSDLYPFTTSREALKGEAQDQIERSMNQWGLKEQVQEYTEIIDALRNPVWIGGEVSPVEAPGTQADLFSQRYGVYPGSTAISQETLQAVADAPFIKTLVEAFAEVGGEAYQAVNEHRGRVPPPVWGGISLNRANLGVNLHLGAIKKLYERIEREAEKAGVDPSQLIPEADLPDGQMILFNPFAAGTDLVATRSVERQGDPLTAREMADLTWATIVHELAHQEARGHDTEFAGIMTRYLGVLSRMGPDATARLEVAWEQALHPDSDYLNLQQRIENEAADDFLFKKLDSHGGGIFLAAEPPTQPVERGDAPRRDAPALEGHDPTTRGERAGRGAGVRGEAPGREGGAEPGPPELRGVDGGPTPDAGEPGTLPGEPGTPPGDPSGEVAEPGPDYDLFGEPVRGEERQGELLPDTEGPVGMSRAVPEAEATVSMLEGRVQRGEATASEIQRYREAKALLRRQEGMDADDLARHREEGALRDDRDPMVGDLFDDPQVRERRNPDGVRDEARYTFGDSEAGRQVVRELAEQAPDLIEISIPGVLDETSRVERVRRGHEMFEEALASVLEAREEGFGWVESRGQRLTDEQGNLDPEKAFQLLRAFRHPSAEYWHAIVLVPTEDGNMEVAHHRMTSSGWIDQAIIGYGDIVEAAAIAAREGGELLLFHNHPSGDPTASPEDKGVTQQARKIADQEGARFAGHLVMDGETATFLQVDENGSLRDSKLNVPLGEQWDWNTERPKVRGPQDAFRLFGKLPKDERRLDILLLDTQHKVAGFTARPISDLESAGEWLPALQRDAGAARVILGAWGDDAHSRVSNFVAERHGFAILDVVNAESGAGASVAQRGHGGMPTSAPILERSPDYGDPAGRDAEGAPGEGDAEFVRERGSEDLTPPQRPPRRGPPPVETQRKAMTRLDQTSRTLDMLSARLGEGKSAEQADLFGTVGLPAFEEMVTRSLTDREADRVLQRARSARGPKEARHAIDLAQRLIKREKRRRAIEDLQNTYKQALRRKLRPEFLEKVKVAVKDIDMESMGPKTRRALRATAEYLKRNPDADVPDHLLGALRRLDLKQLKRMDPDEIRAITDQVRYALKLNRTKNQLLGRQRRREKERTATQAVGEMQERVKELKRTRDRVTGQAGARRRSAVGLFFKEASTRPEVILEHLSPTLQELAWEEVTVQAHDAHLGRLWDYRQRTQEAFLEATGHEIGTEAFERWRTEAVEVPAVDTEDGSPVTMTRDEAIWFLGVARDPSNLAILYRNGYTVTRTDQHFEVTDELIEALREEVGAEGGSIVDFMSETFNGDMKAHLNEAWVEKYGYEVAQVPDYWPRSIDMERTHTQADPLEVLSMDREATLTSWGHLRERVGTGGPIKGGSALDAWNNHAEHVARISSYLVPVANAHSILGHRDVKRAMLQRVGKEGYERILKSINMQTTPVVSRSEWERMSRFRLRMVGGSILALRATTLALNPSGLMVSAGYQEHGFRNLARALATMQIETAEQEGEWRRVERLASEYAPYWRERYDNFVHQTTSGMALEGSRSYGRPDIAELGLMPLQWSDQFGATVRWKMAEFHIDRTRPDLEQGSDRYNKEVGLEWMRLMFRGENTSHGGDMTGALSYGRENVWFSPLVMFTSSVSKIYSLGTRAAFQWQRGEHGPAIASAAGVFGATMWAAVVREAFRSARGQDEDDERRITERMLQRMATEASGYIPVVGDQIIVPALNRLLGLPTPGFGASVFEDVLQKAGRVVPRFVDAIEAGLTEELDASGEKTFGPKLLRALDGAAELAALGLGAPYGGPKDAARIVRRALDRVVEGAPEDLRSELRALDSDRDLTDERRRLLRAIRTNDPALFRRAVEEMAEKESRPTSSEVLATINRRYGHLTRYEPGRPDREGLDPELLELIDHHLAERDSLRGIAEVLANENRDILAPTRRRPRTRPRLPGAPTRTRQRLPGGP